MYKINYEETKYNGNETEITGIITNIKYKDEYTILTVKSKENILVYSYNNNFNLGEKIKIKGTLNKINNNTISNLFNYRKYLLSKNIHYKMVANSIIILKENNNIFYKIKNYIIKRNNKNAYLNAFLLGDTSFINVEVMISYRINGISHLFAISGMHVSIICTILLFILNKIKKTKFNYLLIFIFLLFYVFLTGYSPSIIRATFMFIFLLLNKYFKLNIPTYKILIFICIIYLFINPYNIYNNGFIFSYLVSITLIFFSKLIYSYKNYFIKLFITSLISFIVTIPILINTNFSINLLTIFNNLVFIPLITLIIFPFSIIVFIFPKLIFIYSFLINVLENISLFLYKYKIEIILSHVNIFILLFYYLIIIFIFSKIYKKKYKYIILLIIIITFHHNINYFNNRLNVSYIDVGQGDSSLIVFPNNKSNILIDTGGNYNYDLYLNIINYLKSKGISSINYLILTHGDFDHIGEAIDLVSNFKVEKVIFNCGDYNDLEKELINKLEEKNIKYYSCINEINIDNYKLKFLNNEIYDNENDNSSVIYLNYNNYKFLFMGDASTIREENILKKYNLTNIDFLKVGHHGSDTSSGSDFISGIKPKYSIISVGKNNRYGHPKESTLETLSNSKIYRTDEDGSIEIKIKSDGYTIETCEP